MVFDEGLARLKLSLLPPPRPDGTRGRAVLPVVLAGGAALVAALVSAMAVGAEPKLDMVRTAEAVAEAAGGRYDVQGLAGVMSRLDGAQLALALRHDPALGGSTMPQLTPGWDRLLLGGKPDPFATVSGLEALRLNAQAEGDAVVKPAPPFAFRPRSQADRNRALRCLTQAVYYEAALEPDDGQAAVAQVVLNRVRDPNYPASVCGVVYQGAERNTGCQFTFTCDGNLARTPVPWAWDKAKRVAERALAGAVAGHVGAATHYHADYVRPWWAPSLTKVSQSGAHIFYRWPGAAGAVSSLSQTYSGIEPVIDEARFARPRGDVVVAEAGAVLPEGLSDKDAQKVRELLSAGNRTVEYEGRTRIVGAPSLGGRRQPTASEISDINARLKAFEEGAVPAEKAPSGD